MRAWMRCRCCRRVRRDVQAYLDNEADPAAASRVARHLLDCPGCFGDAATLQRLVDAVASLEPPADPLVLERLRRRAEGLTGP